MYRWLTRQEFQLGTDNNARRCPAQGGDYGVNDKAGGYSGVSGKGNQKLINKMDSKANVGITFFFEIYTAVHLRTAACTDAKCWASQKMPSM